MKDKVTYAELIKWVYDKLEESCKITIDKVSETEVSEEKTENAYRDIVERLSIKLKGGKCSRVFLNQLTRHHCNIGERFGDRIEFYSSRNIIDIIELLEHGGYSSRQFKRDNSLIKGLWKSHHNGRSQFYAYVKNIKQYWLKKNGELKRDISEIIQKNPNNPKAVLTEMQYKALIEKHKKNELTGEWIVFARHNDINYYLCLAVHEESGINDINTYNTISPCFDEFPELNHYKKE